MTGLLRILVFFLFGYILFKTIKYVISVYTSIKDQQRDARVKESEKSSSKIDKKDVIDAHFEEIEDSDKSSQSD